MTVPYQSLRAGSHSLTCSALQSPPGASRDFAASSPIVIHYWAPRSGRYAVIWLCQKSSGESKKLGHRV